MLRILLTGKTGQIGYELERSLQGLGAITAVDRTQMDLANLDQVRAVIRMVRPDLIVNAAAYTAVDKAETETTLAMCINGEAPGVMAEEAKKLGAAMIHYSTDYVFDGKKSTAYNEGDPVCPINAYGRSKLAGEQAVQAAGIPHLILRTSWVYGMRGRNFLLAVLRLSQEREELRIVGDQHGAPTWCRTVADTTAHIVAKSEAQCDKRDWWGHRSGIYHVTAQGETTWYGFANAILNSCSNESSPVVVPISTNEIPLRAQRPVNSRLSCEQFMKTFCDLPEWEHTLRLCRS
jgi:dTDP-4-dehydrorhamnose reductase